MGQGLEVPHLKQLSICMPESELSLNTSLVGGIALSLGSRHVLLCPVLETHTLQRTYIGHSLMNFTFLIIACCNKCC